MAVLRSLAILLLAAALASGCASSERATTPTASSSNPAAADTSRAAAANRETAPDNDSAADTTAALSTAEAPQDWFHRAPDAPTPGMGTERAYRSLLAGRTPRDTVVVAVIDSGIDIEHEDLAAVAWQNHDETPGNGVDDDQNGYVDDVHGWNFIGGPDGQDVEYDTYEVTRLYRSLRKRFADMDSSDVPPDARDAFQRYQRIKREFQSERREAQQQLRNLEQVASVARQATDILKAHLGVDTLTEEAVVTVASPSQRVQRAQDLVLRFYNQGFSPEDLIEYYDYLERQVEYNYNPEFNPRPIVGDDYSDKTERVYGNSDVEGPDAEHGTHVGGIVGAARDNALGIDGVATSVRLMAIRTVPNGDERDKDVANAIRYAVDNGADVINMSFGKSYSPYKKVVDAAVQHADSMGVLMVHAAGNDGVNIDSTAHYPTRTYADGGQAELWIEVGASSWNGGKRLAATFSNYGAETVDVFAPGTAIYSTVPNDRYDRIDGTSMAAPMVSGLAALIMAYHPELSPQQVRRIILETATSHADKQVAVPGSSRTVPFSALSRTGAIVNAYAALERAAQMASR